MSPLITKGGVVMLLSKRPLFTVILSIIWLGTGHLLNGQWAKGTFLAFFHGFVLFWGRPRILRALRGLVTLGETAGQDHSIFLLIQGLVSGLIVLVLGFLYVILIIDSVHVARGKERGRKGSLAFPVICLSPAVLFSIFICLLPILFGFSLAFTNYDLYNSPPARLVRWVGPQNFRDLFSIASWRTAFLSVLSWNIVWAFISVAMGFVLGLFLALLLNQEDLRFKPLFRTILILPWAIPAFVSILVWTGLLNHSFGPINLLLASLGFEKIPWLTNAFWAKISLFVVNLWLTFPFQMALCMGIIQGIPGELLEAATVDGASSMQGFLHITLPLVLYSAGPLLIMQVANAFNNFGMIYLLTEGGPPQLGMRGAGATDLLISWIFKLTLTLSRYDFAAVVSVLIFIPIAVVSLLNLRTTRAFKDEGVLAK